MRCDLEGGVKKQYWNILASISAWKMGKKIGENCSYTPTWIVLPGLQTSRVEAVTIRHKTLVQHMVQFQQSAIFTMGNYNSSLRSTWSSLQIQSRQARLENGERCTGFWCHVCAVHASGCLTVGLVLKNSPSKISYFPVLLKSSTHSKLEQENYAIEMMLGTWGEHGALSSALCGTSCDSSTSRFQFLSVSEMQIQFLLPESWLTLEDQVVFFSQCQD